MEVLTSGGAPRDVSGTPCRNGFITSALRPRQGSAAWTPRGVAMASRINGEGHAGRLSSWRRRVEPWYLAYALLGATVAGMVPILVPLTVSYAGNAGEVGLVMAAVSLGGLTAPVWGTLADRHRLHRSLLAGGLLTTALGLAVFPFTTTPVVWLGLALLAGVGAAAAATVANLFVVEAHPQIEWDDRIGWLQTFYGGGQVAGLLLSGAFNQVHPRYGLLVAAGLTALAVVPGWFTTHTPAGPLIPKPILLHPARHGEWAIGSPQRLFHHLRWGTFGQMRLPFGLFLLAWLLSFAGAAAMFSLYPVLMQQLYAVSPGLSSIGFGVAAGLALALYSPAGRWSGRYGPARVLRIALAVRLLAFVGLLALGLTHPGDRGWLALLAFLFVVLTWSLLSVSGTALTAQLTPANEGQAMGLFNATTAVAGVLGAVLGGWCAGRWGYAAALGLAVLGVAGGLMVTSLSGRSGTERRGVA
jgi:DHA1 family tetracycline resistance protein-like MFS transporter